MNKENVFATVPLRGVVLFPEMTLHFDVGRKASLSALRNANGQDVFFVTQKDISVEKPDRDDLYDIGVIGTVRQIIRLPEHTPAVRVVVEGKCRAKLKKIVYKKQFMKCEVEMLEDDKSVPEVLLSDEHVGAPVSSPLIEEAALFSIRRFFDEYAENIHHLADDIYSRVFTANNLGLTIDFVAGNVMLPVEEKMKVLSELNVYRRTEILCAALAKETEILELDAMLQEKVQEQMDKNQREYYLREELKAITDELGDLEGTDDVKSLISKISGADMPEDVRAKLLSEAEKLRKMSPSSSEGNVIRSYIEKCLELPWGIFTQENTDIEKAKKILEKDHFGLKDVKERIIEMLSALIVSPDIKGQIICLAGPPGVGKTSVARSIAKATGRKYTRVSLGGVRDEAEIRGHRKTYIGAMPGRIINAVIEAGSMNCLVLLDEIDKLGNDFKGDPASALLEVLDREQNFSFRDHYVELPVDLSKILFITTANDKHMIPDALRDRMEIIELPSYTYEEKFHIAKKHLIPKQLKEHGLSSADLRINDTAVRNIIDGYTREAGVRLLERKIAAICRKETVRIAEGNKEKLVVTNKNLEELLGVRKYRPEENVLESHVGVVNGLAWTSVGGELLKAEAVILTGTGKIEYTGSLGDVMKESVRTAVSYVRSRAEMLGIDPSFYKDKDIHVHFPEGAVPKDGPSAGVTVTTALVSALTGRKVRGDVAMTGEVTLTGRVLPIGGLREKSMAAYREKIGTVIIPFGNVPDIEEIDDAVKAKIDFIPVKNVDEVLDTALLGKCNTATSKEKNKKDSSIPVIPKSESSIGISCEGN